MRLDEKIALEKEEAAEKATKEATQNTKNEIAKNLKSIGYPIEDISKVTGLSLEEIEKL